VEGVTIRKKNKFEKRFEKWLNSDFVVHFSEKKLILEGSFLRMSFKNFLLQQKGEN